MEILKSQPRSSSLSVFEAKPDQENEEQQSKPEISRIPSRHKRSMSANLMTTTRSFDFVLSLSHQTMFCSRQSFKPFSQEKIPLKEKNQNQLMIVKNMSPS
ncbi:hypothetical protein Dsin_005625 [Dipteronia sinensis]|uniref:Uncharacterized protein n=1 Tax=Dipteronia sinensis TaxID=43782 RepID=A0AAE0AWW4_9ROSI|nr:hypothetical protein Dsin_005625 [Dipteronia sinensis]